MAKDADVAWVCSMIPHHQAAIVMAEAGLKGSDNAESRKLAEETIVSQKKEISRLETWLREHAESAFHPCGTCKMGRASDPMAVVVPECRVIGVEGLRVADSSIFPRVANVNLNAPSIMTGEKAADHILGRQMLAPSNQEPWINPRWQVSDR